MKVEKGMKLTMERRRVIQKINLPTVVKGMKILRTCI